MTFSLLMHEGGLKGLSFAETALLLVALVTLSDFALIYQVDLTPRLTAQRLITLAA